MNFNIKKFKNEKGSILIFSLLILTVIMTISLTLTQVFIPKMRVIGESVSSTSAVYAADSIMEWCLYGQRNDSGRPQVDRPIMENGATYDIYRGDDNTPANCTLTEVPLNYRAVGTYGGVSRSFQVTETPYGE